MNSNRSNAPWKPATSRPSMAAYSAAAVFIAEVVSAMPKPRPVRIRGSAILETAFVLAIYTLFEISVFQDEFASRKNWDVFSIVFFLIISAVIVSLFTWILMEALKIRALLATGEVVIATVNYQCLCGHRKKQSEIYYDFIDSHNKRCDGEGFDRTRTYDIGSKIIVFYDAADPNRNVAGCSTDWTIRTPEGVLLDLA